MNRTRFMFSLLLVLIVAAGMTGCAMMRPPEMEEEPVAGTAGPSGEDAEATSEARYTHEQVVDAITTTLISLQFRYTLKRTDVEKGEVETQWRDEETFEGSGSGARGSEDKYRSFVVVSFDFQRNRVNITRTAQFLDFYINDWRDISPRRYHRDEDMQIQKVIMERIEEAAKESTE